MAREKPHKTVDLSVIYWRTLWRFSGKNALYPPLFFVAGFITPLCFQILTLSTCCSQTRRGRAIYHNNHYRHNSKLHKPALFFSVRKMFWTAFYRAGHPDVMENPLAVNNVFFRREKKSFILFQLNARVFSKHLSKAAKEKLNCSVLFELISPMQYGAIFLPFLLCQHCAAPGRVSKWISGPRCMCLHFHLLVHSSVRLFTRVPYSRVRKWLKRTKKKKQNKKKGRVFGAEHSLIPLT